VAARGLAATVRYHLIPHSPDEAAILSALAEGSGLKFSSLRGIEHRLGLTSREAIYPCPKRFQPIIMSSRAAMFGAVPRYAGAFPRRRSDTLRWHDGCRLFGPTARSADG
jgi:hypothetical protein